MPGIYGALPDQFAERVFLLSFLGTTMLYCKSRAEKYPALRLHYCLREVPVQSPRFR